MLVYLQAIDNPEDRTRFEAMYSAYRGLMFHVARRILNNDQDAEDAVHMAFLSLAEHSLSQSLGPRARCLAATVAERKAIDLYRARQRHPQAELAAVIALLGTAVHANQPEDYRVRAAARDGVLTYSARPQEDVVSQQFHRITFGWTPEGYALWRESELEEDTVYSSISYWKEGEASRGHLSLCQWMGQEYSETLMGDYRWEGVTVRGSEGIFIDAAGDRRSYTLLWAEGPYVLQRTADTGLDRETFFKIAENLAW